ncbi:exodeoxyribonuclease V subunit gamma [Aliidiomarina sp. Khilg15.8]
MSELTPGFIVAHSHRLEDLTDVAVQLMHSHPLNPLQQETILVQSNGIAQWLKTELAQTTGIAAMLDVSLPARFVWKAYRAVLGNQIPKHSPYDKDRLVWRLMRLLPALMDTRAEFSSLKRYTANDEDQRKHFQLCEKIADLLDQYQIYRADWLDAWSQGRDVIISRGEEQALEDIHCWQPALWRALVEDIGATDIWSNRAALHRAFIEQAQTLSTRPAELPPRVVVFGISSLPQQTLEVLHAIKGYTQILLCVHNPCQHFWADIVDGRELFQRNIQARQSAKEASDFSLDELHQHAQPLLASWGKQGRDYIRLLDLFDETRDKETDFDDIRFDIFDEQPPHNLLQQLQSDILNLRPLHETHTAWGRQVACDDRSIALHSCHSPQREVEVLHDQLLAALARDPELNPRDIMVMVPDINTYAPYIEAVFGRLQTQDPRYIPYTIADQGQRHRNPLLIALDMILSAPQSRFASSDIFDLLHVPAVQRRFSLRSEQIELLQTWCAQSGARWGLSELQRNSLGVFSGSEQNSWRFALRRMMQGYAAGARTGAEANATPWRDIEPYAEVAGIQAEAAGALYLLIERLEEYWQVLASPRTPSQWSHCLGALLDAFFVADNDDEELIISRLRSNLDVWLDAAEEADFDSPLRYNIAQELWLSSMEEAGLNQRFLAGAVNFATLMPMRAIPFKRVCLLGMNDADYPRTTQKTDFDLMAHDYRPGDRSRREDDRYLFLEAMLSARDQLYISWVGCSSRDNSEIPASVLVGQLQDHLVAGWARDETEDAAMELQEQLTTRHYLQPFSGGYFATNNPGDRYFTYASEWMAVHKPEGPTATSLALSPFVPSASFSLRRWVEFLLEPAKLFSQQRLGVYLVQDERIDLDDERFAADGLFNWQLKQEALQRLMHLHKRSELQTGSAVQQALDECFKTIQRRGDLPLGEAGNGMLLDLRERVEGIFNPVREYLQGRVTRLDDVAFVKTWQGLTFEDYLTDLYRDAEGSITQLCITVSKVAEVKPRGNKFSYRHLIDPWLRHLIATVQLPEQAVQTLIIGEGASVWLPAVDPDQAQQCLNTHADYMHLALRKPLPTALELSIDRLLKSEDKRTPESLRNLYEGGYTAGKKAFLPYTARYFPSADSLLEETDFDATSEDLFAPLLGLLEQSRVEGGE